VGGGAGDRPQARGDPAQDRAAAGAARHRAADDQPVPEPDEEQLAGGRDRLPGHRLDRQHHAEPDGQAIEGIAIIMLVYLTISLSISLFMNWYNARIALVER
jgi:hypothetical protein